MKERKQKKTGGTGKAQAVYGALRRFGPLTDAEIVAKCAASFEDREGIKQSINYLARSKKIEANYDTGGTRRWMLSPDAVPPKGGDYVGPSHRVELTDTDADTPVTLPVSVAEDITIQRARSAVLALSAAVEELIDLAESRKDAENVLKELHELTARGKLSHG